MSESFIQHICTKTLINLETKAIESFIQPILFQTPLLSDSVLLWFCLEPFSLVERKHKKSLSILCLEYKFLNIRFFIELLYKSLWCSCVIALFFLKHSFLFNYVFLYILNKFLRLDRCFRDVFDVCIVFRFFPFFMINR